jgi:hypothetical protein
MLDFLPNSIKFDGNWNSPDGYVDKLYIIFKNDFLLRSLTFGKSVVKVNRQIKFDQKEESFWHLITRQDKNHGERCLEIRRAERLPWIRPMIINYTTQFIKYWRHLEDNNLIRHYLWLEQMDYIVILEEKRMHMFLVTAFCVDTDWTRKNLLKKYNNRLV